jgi:hypothetical protein
MKFRIHKYCQIFNVSGTSYRELVKYVYIDEYFSSLEGYEFSFINVEFHIVIDA